MTQERKISLIIGLGNPDKKYQDTYHNVGHLFLDILESLKTKNSVPIGRQVKLKTLKSSAYMNESGLFVKNTLKKEKIRPRNLLIIHDDSDLELGKIKLQYGRGSAGHKGVQNIIDQLKTKDFWRLRIGIRPPEQSPSNRFTARIKAEEFVLKNISATNKKVLEKIFKDWLDKII